MSKVLLPLLLLASLPRHALAEVACTDRPECWPDGSAMRTGLLLVQELTGLQAQLAERHERLVARVTASSHAGIATDGRLLPALASQQSAWARFVAEDCALVGLLTGAGGAWPSTHARECEVDRTTQRLRRVQAAIDCVDALPPETRVFRQNACLASLTAPGDEPATAAEPMVGDDGVGEPPRK